MEFSEAPIASIPFLCINWDNDKEVLLHDKIREETRCYLSSREKEHQTAINELFNTLFNEKNQL